MTMKRRVHAIVASTAATILLLLGASLWLVKAIDDDAADIESDQRRIDEQYELRRLLRGPVTDLAATKKDVGRLYSTGISEDSELEFVRALEKAAAETGVEQTISLETVNQKAESEWEKTIPVSLHLIGTYPEVLRMMNAVERLPYSLAIASVSITSGQGDTVRAEVSGTVRWLGDTAPDFVYGRDGGTEVMNP